MNLMVVPRSYRFQLVGMSERLLIQWIQFVGKWWFDQMWIIYFCTQKFIKFLGALPIMIKSNN